MEYKLVVVGGDAKVNEVNLRLPAVIGRGRGATIMLRHPLVSRKHCEIFEVEGQLRVRDLGSLNGTFVGNKSITEAPLPPGELLTVGTVTFRAVYGDAPDLSPSPTESEESPRPAPGDKTERDPMALTVRGEDSDEFILVDDADAARAENGRETMMKKETQAEAAEQEGADVLDDYGQEDEEGTGKDPEGAGAAENDNQMRASSDASDEREEDQQLDSYFRNLQ